MKAVALPTYFSH